jgi:hypothetical protein
MKLALRRGSSPSGYGNVADALEAAFRRFGVEVVGQDEPAPVVLCVLPPWFAEAKRDGQALWCLTMFEADGCPDGYRTWFSNFDGLIVPTAENLAAFSPHHGNVHKVPLGVDTSFWSPRPRSVDGTFRFLYTAHSPTRKGGQLAEEAGRRLRREGLDVEMVPARAVSDGELRDLFWSCHAYVQPSFGEGWGMMPHQALATGMPAVVSDCGGHREYGWLPGCYLTATRRVPSLLTFGGDPGMWWQPDLESLVARMRWVVENYAEAHAAARQAPGLCATWFDWDEIAAKILGLIGLDVLARPDPAGDPAPLVDDWFPIVPSDTFVCDIGTRRWEFTAGRLVRVPADVKRVLLEAGKCA